MPTITSASVCRVNRPARHAGTGPPRSNAGHRRALPPETEESGNERWARQHAARSNACGAEPGWSRATHPTTTVEHMAAARRGRPPRAGRITSQLPPRAARPLPCAVPGLATACSNRRMPTSAPRSAWRPAQPRKLRPTAARVRGVGESRRSPPETNGRCVAASSGACIVRWSVRPARSRFKGAALAADQPAIPASTECRVGRLPPAASRSREGVWQARAGPPTTQRRHRSRSRPTSRAEVRGDRDRPGRADRRPAGDADADEPEL
jgi:hypothetical protein